jgi:hypothetical protein
MEKYDLVLMVSFFFEIVSSFTDLVCVHVGYCHAETGRYIGDVDDSTVRSYNLHDKQLETERNLTILFVG